MLLRMAALGGIWAGLVGLLIAVGEFVIHSAAITHFDNHVTRGTSLVFIGLALTVATLTRGRAVTILAWLVAGLAVGAVAFSRVELGVHWTTDVAVSIVFVTVWLTAAAISLGGRLQRPEPAGPEPAGGVSSRPRRWPRRAVRAGSA